MKCRCSAPSGKPRGRGCRRDPACHRPKKNDCKHWHLNAEMESVLPSSFHPTEAIPGIVPKSLGSPEKRTGSGLANSSQVSMFANIGTGGRREKVAMAPEEIKEPCADAIGRSRDHGLEPTTVVPRLCAPTRFGTWAFILILWLWGQVVSAEASVVDLAWISRFNGAADLADESKSGGGGLRRKCVRDGDVHPNGRGGRE